LESISRVETSRLTDQSDQAVKDANKHDTAEGLAGLNDRSHMGWPRKLDAARRQQLHDIALARPDVAVDHLSAYTRGRFLHGPKKYAQTWITNSEVHFAKFRSRNSPTTIAAAALRSSGGR
jgi:hypothetical protein